MKCFYSQRSKQKAQTLFKYRRGKISRYINVTTGHNNLAYHTRLQYPEHSDSCNFRNTDRETFFRWATECPTFWLSRRTIFLDQLPDPKMEWKVDKVVKFTDIPVIDNLLSNDISIFNDQSDSFDSEY